MNNMIDWETTAPKDAMYVVHVGDGSTNDWIWWKYIDNQGWYYLRHYDWCNGRTVWTYGFSYMTKRRIENMIPRPVGKPHVHIELIKKWVEDPGAYLVQVNFGSSTEPVWRDCAMPAWNPNSKYRMYRKDPVNQEKQDVEVEDQRSDKQPMSVTVEKGQTIKVIIGDL